jgi:hypothetical protein
MKSSYFLIGAVSLLLGSGCFLTSSRPATIKKMIPERDVQVLEELSNIFNESSQISSDFNRLVSFSLGDFTRQDGEMETMTDAVEYVALFEPFDYGDLSWKDGTVNRFSKEIWNEAIYYLQKVNPQFKLRAEGRIALDEDKRYRIEALVLTVDRTKEVSKENSESILTASQTCLQKKCEIEILIDQKGISKALSQLKIGESWLGTSGTISAKISEEKTIAKIRNINLRAAKYSVVLNNVTYERNRTTNDSIVNAAGSIVSVAGETKSFTIVGNLRKPESLSLNVTSSALEPLK